MHLQFVHKAGQGRPVVDSHGNQEVIAHLMDGTSSVVLILDKQSGSYYINKLVSSLVIELYHSDNFMAIEDELEWDAYHDLFTIKQVIPPNPIRSKLGTIN